MPGFELTPVARSRARCRIVVERGAIARVPALLAGDGAAGVVAIVCDDHVEGPYARPLAEACADLGLDARVLAFPAGEASKTRATKARLEDRLAEIGAGRDAVVVAVGGGVAGDLAGFVAATWMRGVRLVQVPTSLLAMVDAAIGGKTGVDVPAGKNLVGAFHLPETVVIDTDVLATLPDAELRNGLAEVVKTATVADVALFRRLERDAESMLARARDALDAVVTACARAKARIVARDERDSDRRAVLNFGHTVAHALEAATGYGVAHGTAVAVGMAVEARIACARVGFPEAHRRRLLGVLDRIGLPIAPPAEVGAEAIVRAAASDKKNRRGRIRCALPRRLGRASARGEATTVEVTGDEIARAWKTSGPN